MVCWLYFEQNIVYLYHLENLLPTWRRGQCAKILFSQEFQRKYLKTPRQWAMKSRNPQSWPVIRNILDLPSLNVNDRGVTIEPKEKWRSPAHLGKHDRNICILCGFSFVSIETIDRKENIYKFYDVNIKSSKERIECVRKVTNAVQSW